MTLGKIEILAADDRRPVPVAVPEWGGDCYLMPLMGDDRDRFDQWGDEFLHGENPDWKGIRARLVAASLCDETGEPLGFTDAEILALGTKSSKALDRLFAVAQRISGISNKDIEDLGKNSSGGPNAGPG